LFIEPTSSHKNSPSLSSFRSRPRRILSDSRSSLNSLSSSSFYSASFCSLGEYVSRPLLRETFFYFRFSLGLLRPTCNRVCFHASAPEKASHRFRLCLVSLRTSLVFLNLAINSFLSRTILVFNSVPFRLPFHVSQPSPPLYSSRYPQCLLYNIVNTL